MNHNPELGIKSLFFIRHAERCDKSQEPEEMARVINKYDPPITKLGAS